MGKAGAQVNQRRGGVKPKKPEGTAAKQRHISIRDRIRLLQHLLSKVC